MKKRIYLSIIYFITDGESPVVYELTKKNSGLSDITCEASLIKLSILSSSFQTSPEGPLPYEGGSIIIPS